MSEENKQEVANNEQTNTADEIIVTVVDENSNDEGDEGDEGDNEVMELMKVFDILHQSVDGLEDKFKIFYEEPTLDKHKEFEELLKEFIALARDLKNISKSMLPRQPPKRKNKKAADKEESDNNDEESSEPEIKPKTKQVKAKPVKKEKTKPVKKEKTKTVAKAKTAKVIKTQKKN